MTKTCARCGKDLNPLTGSLEASHVKVEQLRKWGMDVPSPVCSACFNESLLLAERRYGREFFFEEDPPADLQEKIEKRVAKLELWTLNPYPPESLVNLGVVSHYVIEGTGPLSALGSAFTDLLGQSGELYRERLEAAEAQCSKGIREKAYNKGADAVVGLSFTIQELGLGNGMFLFAMSGTAVAPARVRRL
ncbi:MAG: heavy metal-binding domain-containing protein [Deltaproteobacteria bacterium]|jgi:uncharacterized protein YbjQ (UPF0145 family)|nr:heavy metal-binding domain-containing protein [Deltaproteobacteria bacterium]